MGYSPFHDLVRDAYLYLFACEVGYSVGRVSSHLPSPDSVIRLLSPNTSDNEFMDFDIEFDGLHRAMVLPIVKGFKTNLIESGHLIKKPAGWGMTPDGMKCAILVHDRYNRKNVTACWVDRNLTPAAFKDLHAYLAMRCVKSRMMGEIDDLAHAFLVRLIARDGLRATLWDNKPLGMTQIRSWAYRTALNQFRDEGRDALTRTSKGANLTSDREGHSTAKEATIVASPIYHQTSSGETVEALSDVIASPTVFDSDIAVHAMTQAIVALNPLVGDYLLEGTSTADIATMTDASKGQVRFAIRQMRASAQRRACEGRLAYDTLQTLSTDNDREIDRHMASRLVSCGYVTPDLQLTPKGRSVVATGDYDSTAEMFMLGDAL